MAVLGIIDMGDTGDVIINIWHMVLVSLFTVIYLVALGRALDTTPLEYGEAIWGSLMIAWGCFTLAILLV